VYSILLVTCEEYSQCTASYWSHERDVLTGVNILSPPPAGAAPLKAPNKFAAGLEAFSNPANADPGPTPGRPAGLTTPGPAPEAPNPGEAAPARVTPARPASDTREPAADATHSDPPIAPEDPSADPPTNEKTPTSLTSVTHGLAHSIVTSIVLLLP
jgi:hypothetical protein